MKIKVSAAAALFTAAAIIVTGTAAASASAAPQESAKARTCAAFAAWEKHRDKAHLDAMAADSFNAGWRYVGEDAWGLYSDVRSGAPAKYVKADIKYFTEDCAS